MADQVTREGKSQSELYNEQLEDVCARAMTGRIKRRAFEREMIDISEANTIDMFFIGVGFPNNQAAQKWLKKQEDIHRKSIKLLADDIYAGRYADTDG